MLLPKLLHFYFFLTLAAGFIIGVLVASYTLSQGFVGLDLGIHEALSTNSTSEELPSTAWNESLVIEPEPSIPDIASAAWNESLGFGEVLYVSMPDRTDRQDAMNLAASMSGLKLRLINGVDGGSISLKAIPDNNANKWTLRLSELGCWRAHADAWRYVIDSNIETALIIEDDIDWDKNVHQIFQDLSSQMQNSTLRLVPPTDREQTGAPYGLDWDVLIMGQCYDAAHPKRLDLVHVYDDPNVPSRKDTEEVFLKQMESLGVRGNDVGKKRLLSPAYGPICTMGYAITRRGAQRLLLNLSYLSLRGPVDMDMMWTLQEGKLRGYSITPPLFTAWRVGGQKDSDNKHDPNLPMSGKGNSGGWSNNIKSSARIAMVNELAMNNWMDYTKKGAPPEKQTGKGNNRESKGHGTKGS
ncbi:hypothetical protein V1520DRAFT_23527 [Lipomyces starkeyi]|uniref:Glycosyl transferase family 25 domain-containing protein n=1 Tax=Lipomyces starkeyi NRRL Y-11557 TaxID=675824 RepID=A0A1E3PZD6_LIPST|nr:hypothetical protein LIPSTDRAFT_5427 [Lipomyces starkeyi NRRL Y-11557]